MRSEISTFCAIKSHAGHLRSTCTACTCPTSRVTTQVTEATCLYSSIRFTVGQSACNTEKGNCENWSACWQVLHETSLTISDEVNAGAVMNGGPRRVDA